LSVPKAGDASLCNTGVVTKEASYADYASIDSKKDRLTEECWNSLPFSKYSCFTDSTCEPFCVFVVTPTVVMVGETPVRVLSVVLSRTTPRTTSINGKVHASLMYIARSVFDVDYVRMIHDNNVCSLNSADVCFNVNRTVNVDVFYSI